MIQLKNLIVAVFVALLVGFVGGYYVKHEFEKADVVTVAQESRKQTATNISEALKEDSLLTAKVDRSNQEVTAIQKKVAARFKSAEKQNEKSSNCPSYYLDVATVSMLNSARSGASYSPSIESDEEGKAPSTIDFATFIDNDTEIVKQYRELAADHDTLVDFVQELVHKQAK